MRSLDHYPNERMPVVPATAGRHVTPTPWTTRQMIVGALATLIPWIAFNLTVNAMFGSTKTSSAPTPPALDIAAGVAVFIFAALLEAIFLIAPLAIINSRRLPRARFRERLRWLGFRATPLAPALLTIIVATAIGLGGSLLYSQAISYFHWPIQTNSDTLLLEGKAAPFTTVGLLASAAIVAPFCEEIFFRGLVFVGLLKRMPLWSAALISAIVFGIAHVDLGSLAPLIIIGLALAWVRWRTDSIWPGIFVHAINNTVAALVLLPLLFK
ncbi:MAG TPA: type II CAAX endopeptidase family protein [Ktedonobacterales bacterium]